MVQSIRRYLDRIQALIIRDMMVRFGRDNLGFVWSILEPMILCTGVLALWSFMKHPVLHGMPVIGFVLTGYMPLTLSRHTINPLNQIFRRNVSLLYHAPLGHLDIAVARLLLEFLSTTGALITIYLILLAVGLTDPVQNWGLLLVAWLYIAWLYSGIGLLIAAATETFEPAEKFIQPAQYLAMPLSGVFFMIDWLPSDLQRLISWIPTIHCFEMFRAGFFGEAVVAHYDLVYLTTWSIALTVLGLEAIRRVPDPMYT